MGWGASHQSSLVTLVMPYFRYEQFFRPLPRRAPGVAQQRDKELLLAALRPIFGGLAARGAAGGGRVDESGGGAAGGQRRRSRCRRPAAALQLGARRLAALLLLTWSCSCIAALMYLASGKDALGSSILTLAFSRATRPAGRDGAVLSMSAMTGL